MANRIAQKNKKISSSRSTTSSKATGPSGVLDPRSWNVKEITNNVKSFATAPATLYVAGGIGAALLARFAFKYYKSHPEITQYVKSNIDTVESKLKEYRTSLASSDTNAQDEAAH